MHRTHSAGHSAVIAVLALFTLALCAVDEPLLSGTIYDRYGTPLANVDVCLYRADYLSNDLNAQKRFPRGASRCRKTDKTGTYKLFFPDRSTYVLIAGKKSIWTMRRITPAADADTIIVSDTLKPAGSLTFLVKAEESSNHSATCALSGTPYSFASDTAGRFSLASIPGGTYGAVIQSLSHGYRAVRCSLRVRNGESDNVAAPLTLPKESIAFVPVPLAVIGKDAPVPAATPSAVPVKPIEPARMIQHENVAQTEPKGIALQAKKEVSPAVKPPVAAAPADTFIGIFEPLILSGTSPDESDVTAREWDIGGTGKFIATPDGRIELPPFKAPINRLPCIYRITATGGRMATDTTFVYAGLLWMSISPPKELLGRNGHSFLTFNDALFIVGGNRSDVWSSGDGINWTMLTQSAPFGNIFGHTTVVFNQRLWIIGGKTGPSTYNSTLWSSSAGVQWQRMGELPFAVRHYHTAVVFNNKIWVIGGITNSENEPFLNDIWSSSDGRSWSRVSGDAPFGKRYGHACTVYHDQLYLLGGFNDAVGSQKSYSDVWKSADGSTWEQLTDKAPYSGSNYHSVCVFDERLWAVGGYSRRDNTDYFSDILFTTDGAQWTNLTADKTSADRFFCASVPFNNRIIISPSDSHKFWIMR